MHRRTHTARYAEPTTPTRQVEAAVRFILQHEGVARVALLAHSWGTMVAGQFAAAHPDLVDRLAFFAPITRRDGPVREQSPAPAWRVVTAADQYRRFVEDVPASEPQVLPRRHFEDWAERYLESDPDSGSRDPAGVKVPTGPGTEIARAWAGELAYEPGLIRAPTAILRGEWDSLVTDATRAGYGTRCRTHRSNATSKSAAGRT